MRAGQANPSPLLLITSVLLGIAPAGAQEPAAPETARESAVPAAPVFLNGEAQVVLAFADSADWIRHDLWVETELDTD
ncbi:MAG: hypothetical protein R6U63_10060, partial [Longimicrobiales bacterium]